MLSDGWDGQLVILSSERVARLQLAGVVGASELSAARPVLSSGPRQTEAVWRADEALFVGVSVLSLTVDGILRPGPVLDSWLVIKIVIHKSWRGLHRLGTVRTYRVSDCSSGG